MLLGAPKLKLKPPLEDAPAPLVLDELAPKPGAGEGLGAPNAGAGEALLPAPNAGAGADAVLPAPKAGADEAPELGCPKEKPEDGAAAPNPEDAEGALDAPKPVPAQDGDQLSPHRYIGLGGKCLPEEGAPNEKGAGGPPDEPGGVAPGVAGLEPALDDGAPKEKPVEGAAAPKPVLLAPVPFVAPNGEGEAAGAGAPKGVLGAGEEAGAPNPEKAGVEEAGALLVVAGAPKEKAGVLEALSFLGVGG